MAASHAPGLEGGCVTSEPAEAPNPASDPEWEAILTTGHGWPRLVRAFLERLPSAPRCKVCSAPFAGVGGRVTGWAGFAPSRKNPFICGRCIDRMPPGGATIDIAVLFADIRGSTTLAETTAAGSYAALMNRFYALATDVLLEHDAIIDKLIGDEVMALFIPGISGPSYHRKAIDAALALRDRTTGDATVEALALGIAVHSGSAYVGNVGSGGVTDFTALGDTVNTAARLQAIAIPGQVVLSADVLRAAGGPPIAGEARTVTVRGRSEPVDVTVVGV
jgi:adenylate cyclase